MSGGDVDLALEQSCDLYLFVVNTVIMGTLIVIGIIGNSLAFLVFWKDNIKTTASFLFQSLAVVDSALLLLAIPIFPIPSFLVYMGWLKAYGEIFPYTLVFILPPALIAQTASIWVVVLVAANRYIAVCFPLKALTLCTISKVKKELVCVLLFAVLYNIPRFAEYHIIYESHDNGTTYTKIVRTTNLGSDKLYDTVYDNALYCTVLLALPIFILTVLNIRLMKALKASRQMRMEEMLNRRHQQDNSVTFVLITVVVVFIICQVPALVGKVLLNVTSKDEKLCDGYQFYVVNIADMLVLLNSAVNFVMYAAFNKRFRHVLIQTVCGCCVLAVDRRKGNSTGRLPQVRVINNGTASTENDNDSSVEDTYL